MASRSNEKYEEKRQHLKLVNNITNFISIADTPCQLHCKPEGQFFSVMLSDSVVDGTPCNPGTRDMCINGVCRVGRIFQVDIL